MQRSLVARVVRLYEVMLHVVDVLGVRWRLEYSKPGGAASPN